MGYSGQVLKSDEISIAGHTGHRKMRTALGFDIILQNITKMQKTGKIAILFINKLIKKFALLKGGEEYGSFG